MKKGISEKNVSRFVNILFLIFEKGDKRKNCAWFFKICKYTFLTFEKWDKGNNCVIVCKYPILVAEKRNK